ncbi:hypothetical protein SpiGrapes_1584 [Sphaerochaeta pleomorpha str. Grapes]|uniref:Uncharacterized protein n=1 Tax=Sphaerochaeta pleomorpha (strain ATCC BAA-1885 / DSM 22778 / Grapes) TaxID=158190 RepID=G8QW93_SPHPG|nr:hypothetical protein SpiGrapes_1584 [Sphaerochaeta pleomorpha str. Grapes]
MLCCQSVSSDDELASLVVLRIEFEEKVYEKGSVCS